MPKIAYPYDPDDLEDDEPQPHRPEYHPPLVEDLVRLKHNGKNLAVAEIVRMVADLKANGTGSRYHTYLKGSPIFELSAGPKGGAKGGARAYGFQAPGDFFLLCRAEWKQDRAADQGLINHTAYIALAFKRGRRVFPTWLVRTP